MAIAVIQKPEQETPLRRSALHPTRLDAVRRAQDVLARHSHFQGRANRFQIVQEDDVLVVRGCVPSFYLKQLLQTVLKSIEGVRWIDNRVDVAAPDGLSSVR